jgi:septal ring factor EnvC (AmiA/AmiB activator)
VSRAACAVVLALVAPVAFAATGTQDVKAQVDGIQRQTAEQGAAVAQMQKRVQTLESQGKQSDQALGEKDRAIADLERQLHEAEAAKAPAAAKTSGK